MEPTQILDLIEACIGKRKIALSPEEFAKVTGRSYITIYRAVRAGHLKHTQNGFKGRIKIDFREVGRILDGKVAA